MEAEEGLGAVTPTGGIVSFTDNDEVGDQIKYIVYQSSSEPMAQKSISWS